MVGEIILEHHQLRGKFIGASGTHVSSFVIDVITDVQPHFVDETARLLQRWRHRGSAIVMISQ